jgi:Concanavalin A-like lectin/glucanases superfamily
VVCFGVVPRTALIASGSAIVIGSGCLVTIDESRIGECDAGACAASGGAGRTSSASMGAGAGATSSVVTGSASGGSGGAAAGYRALVLGDGPAAYWRLGEANGTVAKDEIGAHDGAYEGAVMLGASGAIAGDPDTAASFPGSGAASVQLGDVFDFAGSTGFSVEVWMRPEIEDSDYRRVVVKRVSDANGNQGYSIYIQQDHGVAFELYRDGTFVGAQASIALHEYSHVVGTYDGTAARIYVNGTQAGYLMGAVSLVNTDVPLVLGAFPSGGNYYSGVIDEVALYPVALSDGQVKAHYTAGIGGL